MFFLVLKSYAELFKYELKMMATFKLPVACFSEKLGESKNWVYMQQIYN